LLEDPAHSPGEGLTSTPKPSIKGTSDLLQINLDTSQTQDTTRDMTLISETSIGQDHIKTLPPLAPSEES